MNNKHILELTLRLSQALDQNYDVVSMETVMSVISALEGTTITKEQLEATRLAKYINQLRRRTKSENLARRAKSLLKKWREMVGMQQSNESSVSVSFVANQSASTAITSNSTHNSASPMPVSDNASHLINPQFSLQCNQRQQQSNNIKQQIQDQPYHSQPSSPANIQEKSNQSKFAVSMSNPSTGSQMPQGSCTNVRKKRKLEKNVKEPSAQPQSQPTSFANLISGLGSAFSSAKNTKNKSEPEVLSIKPVETFIIEHSSNSNSDLICIPSLNTVSNNFTSATDVPPVVIDLQDTNSSMNSVVSKDVTDTSSSLYRNKISGKKSKKDKKRKERNITSQQNQPQQDCEDQNTTTALCQHKRQSDILLLDEKSHSACPTISNISEILSLSNSSVSSVFPSADAMSKNIYQSGQNESASSTAQMSKSDLTFAGKFKQNASSISTSCNVVNYSSDSTNANNLNYNSPKQSNFSLFGGIETNSNDSSSSSQTSSFHISGHAGKRETNTSGHNIEDGIVRHDIQEKSMSNMSNKGNSSTDNIFIAGLSAVGTIGQQQQSIDLTMDFSSEQTVKQPKKRGRKKGSKGIDSVIAKETSLSSQMLISSLGVAGKKVKTTKELYAEMENRKLRNVKVTGLGEMLGNSSITCTGHEQQPKVVDSRRPSFCSEVGDSDSCTMTSEPSRDSSNVVTKAAIGKSEKPLGNNSNFPKDDSKLKAGNVKSDENIHLTDENSVLESTSKIKLEIQGILKLMTTPPSVTEIEYESFNTITPCTCTIEEIAAPTNNESNEGIADDNDKDSNVDAICFKNIDEKESNNFPIKMEQIENLTYVFKRVGNDHKDTLPQQQQAKVKKSIFDLDFDDDEDPLNSIIADIAGKNFKAAAETTITPPVVDDKPELLLNSHDYIGKSDLQNYALNDATPASDNTTFPSYEIKFDPDCKAKNRFEIQTQKITKFHINTLHNCFISNVNGNWSHAPVDTSRSDIDKADLIIDGYDVVPLYGSDINEKIVKDISHVKFSKLHKVKRSKYQNRNKILFHVPFLGVSRIPDYDNTNLYSKIIKTETMDEEKENVHNKFNLNNILNTSALDTNGAKDKLELEMITERNQSFEISSNSMTKSNQILKTGIKRMKKHATLVKKSTIKRLKLPVNGNLDFEATTSDSNDTDNIKESKLHRTLFYHKELYPMVRSESLLYKKCLFHISSCSSGCSSTEEEATNETFSCRKCVSSTSLSSSSSSSEHQILSLQREIIRAEMAKIEKNIKNEGDILDSSEIDTAESDITNHCDDKVNENEGNDLPEGNNHMLLSFNNIYYKSTREENSEQQNKDHEINMLKQQLQNCDDYNNLNNFNLIKYIENKTSSISNINNNKFSNNYSDTNINLSSSSYNNENPTNSAFVYHQKCSNNNSNDNNVQSKSFKEYQTDDDINDYDGNNCSRLRQFREWHEVLQFRSYNDELLTILPYVVLE